MKSSHWMMGCLMAMTCGACTTEFPISSPGTLEQLPAGVTEVPVTSRPLMEGVYSVSGDASHFGGDAVVKWNGKHLSFFTRNNYLTFNTGTLDSSIYLSGYWRVPTSDDNGLVTLTLAKEDGAASLLKGVKPATIVFKGKSGNNQSSPSTAVTFTFTRPFSATVTSKNFLVVAHRGGGRTSDRLPVSENTTEMIGYAGRFGANGIEIDVRLTKDRVPVLYHDDDINIRLTQKSPLNGPIENFTWDQLNTVVRLIRGERIPKLVDALKYTIDSTAIQFVWFDVKDPDVVPILRSVQKIAYDYAATKGRSVQMLMGVPAEDVLEAMKAQPDYTSIPTLCEISPEAARDLNSQVWGPRWTLGTQNDLVASVQAEGRKAVCWTIDVPAYINQFIQDGRFDGLLTNYPSYVAYYYYIRP